MKKKLLIRNLINWLIATAIMVAMVVGWYFTNSPDPSNVPDKMLEQIQQEEGLK